MPSNVFVKAAGLTTSHNALDLAPGSMTQASNVIIQRDGVVESRRGFKIYGNSLGSSSDRAKQLIEYQQRILRHYDTTLEYDSGTVDSSGVPIFNAFSGSFTEPSPGLRIKSIGSNGNLYFTSSTGIQKISAASASQFTTNSGYITPAGGVKALDIQASLKLVLGQQNGFFDQDSAVAYRTLWLTNDANDDLVSGTPSQRVVIYNPLLGLLLTDYMRLLGALDDINQGASLVNAGNYVSTLKLLSTASATTLRNSLISLAAKIDTDIVNPVATVSAQVTAATQVTVVYASSQATYISPGSAITLSGFTNVALTQLNGLHYTVNTVSGSTITLTVIGATLTPGGSTADVNGVTNSYNYEVIAVPSIPSTPATDNDLVAIQTYLNNIIRQLQLELSGVIPTSISNSYIQPITITTSSSVILDIDIPQNLGTNYFLQIYRSNLAVAVGTGVLANLIPDDEQQLVYEAYPTTAELAAGKMTVNDIVLDAFKGANLYTNANSGEGIAQANDLPPFALDINRFKNYIFYANTKTRHRFPLDLLGIQNFKAGAITNISVANPTVITSASHGLTSGDLVWVSATNSTPVISGFYSATVTGVNTFTVPVNVTVSGTTGYFTSSLLSIHSQGGDTVYKFVRNTAQVTSITTTAGTLLSGKYFTIDSGNSHNSYYVWFNTGASTDPAVANRTGIQVLVSAADANTVIATKLGNTLARYIDDFTTSISTNVVTVTNVTQGPAVSATVGTSGFTIATVVGFGENAANHEIGLSNAVSPAQAIDETSRSLIRVINQNASESVYGFYLSSDSTIPGNMIFESRAFSTTPFYILASNVNTGFSFSPDISPFPAINISNTVASPTVIAATAHGLVSGDQVLIEMSNSTPSINGVWTVTFIDNNHFSIPVVVTTAGTTGVMRKLSAAQVSQNEAKVNRIYYSKFLQPDAVPLTNYLDVGTENKAILRIFPLRDTLFVFKEDGLYRISGEVAPFNIALFDPSCILIAPDSLDVTNNQLYCWSIQGIVTVSESGVSDPPISRPIDIDILKLASSNYTNFATATWGVGYKSDNSYTVFTVQATSDSVAQIGYRWSNLTQSWTTVDKSNTCGIVTTFDDKLYMGAGDVNFIEQERKSFTRLDYADREISTEILSGNYFNNGSEITLTDVSSLEEGDVFFQTQYITPYNINSLLQKLDLDPGVGTVKVSSISSGSTVTVVTSHPHNLATGNHVTISNSNTVPTIDGTYVATVSNATTFTIVPSNVVLVGGSLGTAKLNYYASLKAFGGDNIRTDLLRLTAKLDTDYNLAETDFSSSIANIGPSAITAISAANPTILTSVANGLADQRIISLSGTNSTPTVNGLLQITRINANTFSINKSVTVAGTTGLFSTVVTDFRDLQACYNNIIRKLNNNAATSFKNYTLVTGTVEIEAVIDSINTVTKTVTLNPPLNFIVGAVTIFKAIPCTFKYAPLTFGDPLGLKHLRETTMMFANKAFTDATLSYATDLLPEFIPVPFQGDGNGIFGTGTGNFGQGFFGGGSNGAPFRTYIPRNCQRCRYLIMKFDHQVAREMFAVYGASVVGEIGQSTRAYR